MARLFDRIKETCAAPGTGNVSLLGAVSGYLAFGATGIFSVGDEQVPYCIADQSGTRWEAGLGTYFSANVLRRDTITGNSAGTFVAIDFNSGTQDVFVSMIAAPPQLAGRVSAQARGLAMP
jgi:hypothetical protein